MVTGEIIFKERGELFGLTLQEDETADGGFLCLHHSFTGRLAFVVCRAVNKTIWYVLPFGPEGFQFFLETLHKIMAKKDVTPRCFLFAFGYDFYSWSQFSSASIIFMPFGKLLLWQGFTSAVEEGCEQSCVISFIYSMSLLALVICDGDADITLTTFIKSTRYIQYVNGT